MTDKKWTREGLAQHLSESSVDRADWMDLAEVVEDYVHSEGLKLALIVLLRFTAVFFGLAAIVAILRIGFGG